MGVRLQIPSMAAWRESFTIAVRSDVEGLTLASPREGEVLIHASE